MIGSCTFNFSILSLVDFISWTYWNGDIVANRGIFIANNDSRQLVVFGLITIVATGILLYMPIKKNQETSYLLLAINSIL